MNTYHDAPPAHHPAPGPVPPYLPTCISSVPTTSGAGPPGWFRPRCNRWHTTRGALRPCHTPPPAFLPFLPTFRYHPNGASSTRYLPTYHTYPTTCNHHLVPNPHTSAVPTALLPTTLPTLGFDDLHLPYGPPWAGLLAWTKHLALPRRFYFFCAPTRSTRLLFHFPTRLCSLPACSSTLLPPFTLPAATAAYRGIVQRRFTVPADRRSQPYFAGARPLGSRGQSFITYALSVLLLRGSGRIHCVKPPL